VPPEFSHSEMRFWALVRRWNGTVALHAARQTAPSRLCLYLCVCINTRRTVAFLAETYLHEARKP